MNYIKVFSFIMLLNFLFVIQAWAGSPAQPQLSQEEKQVQAFFQSKLGKMLIRKAEKKQARLEEKAKKGNLKAQHKLEKIKEIQEAQKTNKVTGDLRLGIIIAAVGIILTVLGVDVLRIIGVILVVVGLVLILLDIL